MKVIIVGGVAGGASCAARLRRLDEQPAFRLAIAIPAGLRSQTPINHTASNPYSAMASHSRAGTLARLLATYASG